MIRMNDKEQRIAAIALLLVHLKKAGLLKNSS